MLSTAAGWFERRPSAASAKGLAAGRGRSAVATVDRATVGAEGPRPRILIAPGTLAVAWPDQARRERTAERQQEADRKRASDLGRYWAEYVGDPADPEPTREVTEWSRKSRARMTRTLAELDYRPLLDLGLPLVMTTLTYPGDWEVVAPTGKAAKRHLDMWRKRFRRAWGFDFMGIWKQEFQARGAVHFHLWGPEPTGLAGEERIAQARSAVAALTVRLAELEDEWLAAGARFQAARAKWEAAEAKWAAKRERWMAKHTAPPKWFTTAEGRWATAQKRWATWQARMEDARARLEVAEAETAPAVGDGLPYREWLSVVWADIVDHPDPEQRRRHLGAGTGVDEHEGGRMTDPRRLAIYFTKHGQYRAKEYQHRVPELWQAPGAGPGRFWGYWGLEKAVEAVEVAPESAVWAARILRRYARAQGVTQQRTVRRVKGGRLKPGAPEVVTGLAGAQLAAAYAATTPERTRYRRVRRRVVRFGRGAGFLCVNDGASLAVHLARALAEPTAPPPPAERAWGRSTSPLVMAQ